MSGPPGASALAHVEAVALTEPAGLTSRRTMVAMHVLAQLNKPQIATMTHALSAQLTVCGRIGQPGQLVLCPVQVELLQGLEQY